MRAASVSRDHVRRGQCGAQRRVRRDLRCEGPPGGGLVTVGWYCDLGVLGLGTRLPNRDSYDVRPQASRR